VSHAGRGSEEVGWGEGKKDYERLSATFEAFIYVSMSHLMVEAVGWCLGFSELFLYALG
jgi:hypothetical protein